MKDIELWRGDCLDIGKKVPKNSVGLVIADLPYATKERKCTANSWDIALDQDKLWTIIEEATSPIAKLVFFCNISLLMSLRQKRPNWYKYELIWEKNRKAGYMSATKMPLRTHEIIAVFSKGPGIYNPQMQYVEKTRGIIRTGKNPTKNRNYGTCSRTHTLSHYRYPSSILKFNRDDKRDGLGHPTQKPIKLLSWLIKSYSNLGDLILDPTAGNMSTALAALQTGRRCVAIEQDAEYYRRGVDRVNKAIAERKEAAQ